MSENEINHAHSPVKTKVEVKPQKQEKSRAIAQAFSWFLNKRAGTTQIGKGGIEQGGIILSEAEIKKQQVEAQQSSRTPTKKEEPPMEDSGKIENDTSLEEKPEPPPSLPPKPEKEEEKPEDPEPLESIPPRSVEPNPEPELVPPPPPIPPPEVAHTLDITYADDLTHANDEAKGSGIEHQLQLTQMHHGALDNVPLVGGVSKFVKNMASGVWQRGLIAPLSRYREQRWRMRVITETGLTDLPNEVVDKAMEKGRENTKKRNILRRGILDRIYNLGANISGVAFTTDYIEAKKWLKNEYEKARQGQDSELTDFYKKSIRQKEAFAGRLEKANPQDLNGKYEHVEAIPDGVLKDRLVAEFFAIFKDYINQVPVNGAPMTREQAERRLFDYLSREGLAMTLPNGTATHLHLSETLGGADGPYKSFVSQYAMIGSTMLRTADYLKENKAKYLNDPVMLEALGGNEANPDWQRAYNEHKLNFNLKVGIGEVSAGARVESKSKIIQETADALLKRQKDLPLTVASNSLHEGVTYGKFLQTIIGNELTVGYLTGAAVAVAESVLPTDMKKAGFLMTATGIPVILATSTIGLPVAIPVVAGVAVGAGVFAGIKEIRRLGRERKSIEREASFNIHHADDVRIDTGLGLRGARKILGLIYGSSGRKEMEEKFINGYQNSAEVLTKGMLDSGLFKDPASGNPLASLLPDAWQGAALASVPVDTLTDAVRKGLRFSSEAKARSDLQYDKNRRVLTFSDQMSEAAEREILDASRREVFVRISKIFAERQDVRDAFIKDGITDLNDLYTRLVGVYKTTITGAEQNQAEATAFLTSLGFDTVEKRTEAGIIDRKNSIAERDKAFGWFKLRKGLHRGLGVAASAITTSAVSGALLQEHTVTQVEQPPSSVVTVDYQNVHFRPPEGYSYDPTSHVLTGNGKILDLDDPAFHLPNGQVQMGEIAHHFGWEQQGADTHELYHPGTPYDATFQGTDATIRVPPDVTFTKVVDGNGHELIHEIQVNGQKVFDGSTGDLNPGSEHDLNVMKGILEGHNLSAKVEMGAPVFSGSHDVVVVGGDVTTTLHVPDQVVVEHDVHGMITKLEVNGTSVSVQDVNLTTQEGLDKFSKLLDSLGLKPEQTIKTSHEQVVSFQPEKLWNELQKPVDHKEFYAYNTPESNRNELDLQTYYDEKSDTFYFNAQGMKDAYQLNLPGSSIGGAHPPHINVPDLIEQQKSPDGNVELGIYVYRPGEPNNGFFISDRADGVIDGQVALQAGDSHHIIQTANGPISLGEVRKLLINDQELHAAAASPQVGVLPDGRVNLQTEYHDFNNIYNNGKDGEMGIIQFGRMNQIEDKPVFQSFAAIRGSNNMPGAEEISKTSIHYDIRTELPAPEPSRLMVISLNRDVLNYGTPEIIESSPIILTVPIPYSQYAELGRQTVVVPPARRTPEPYGIEMGLPKDPNQMAPYGVAAVHQTPPPATETEESNEQEAISREKMDERSTELSSQIGDINEELENPSITDEETVRLAQEKGKMESELRVMGALQSWEDLITKGKNSQLTLTDEQIVELLKQNSAFGITTIDELHKIRKNPEERRKLLAKIVAAAERKVLVNRNYELKAGALQEKEKETYRALRTEAAKRAIEHKSFTGEEFEDARKKYLAMEEYKVQLKEKTGREFEDADVRDMLRTLGISRKDLEKARADFERYNDAITVELLNLLQEKYPEILQDLDATEATRLAHIEKIIEKYIPTPKPKNLPGVSAADRDHLIETRVAYITGLTEFRDIFATATKLGIHPAELQEMITSNKPEDKVRIRELAETLVILDLAKGPEKKLENNVDDIEIPIILPNMNQPNDIGEVGRTLKERVEEKRNQLYLLSSSLFQKDKKPNQMSSEERSKAMLHYELVDISNNLSTGNDLYPHYSTFIQIVFNGRIASLPSEMIQGIDLERLKTDAQYRIDSFTTIYRNQIEEKALNALLYFQADYEELMANARSQALLDKSISQRELDSMDKYKRAQADIKVFQDSHPLLKKTGPLSNDENKQYHEERRNFYTQLAVKYGYTSYEEMYELQSSAELQLKRKVIQMTKSEDLLSARTEHYKKIWGTVLNDVEFSRAEASVTPSGTEREPQTKEEFVEKGVELIKNGNYAEAIKFFNNPDYGRKFGVHVSATGTSRLSEKNPENQSDLVSFSNGFARGCWFHPPNMITYGTVHIQKPDGSYMSLEEMPSEVLFEVAEVSAEEWIHFLQEGQGPVAGQQDHEVDVAAYLINHGIKPSLAFMLRYDRAEALNRKAEYEYDDSLNERPAFRRGVFVSVPNEIGMWQIVSFDPQTRSFIVQRTDHSGKKEIKQTDQGYQEFMSANDNGVYPFAGVHDLNGLYQRLSMIKNVWGYSEEFTAQDLQNKIEAVRQGKTGIETIPRSGGLRQVVSQLIQVSPLKSSMNAPTTHI